MWLVVPFQFQRKRWISIFKVIWKIVSTARFDLKLLPFEDFDLKLLPFEDFDLKLLPFEDFDLKLLPFEDFDLKLLPFEDHWNISSPAAATQIVWQTSGCEWNYLKLQKFTHHQIWLNTRVSLHQPKHLSLVIISPIKHSALKVNLWWGVEIVR